MRVKRKVSIVFTIVIILVISTAAAHVPESAAENESLDGAKEIEDPTKSWVLYSELRDGQVANYYEMEMEEGDRLYSRLMLPDNGDFVPNLAVIGPGIEVNDTVPEFVEKPDGVGIKVIEGELGEREYEPFTPASYYYPARFDEDIDESGTYHVVVYNKEETRGKYGLAVGYQETWGPIEWILLPLDLIDIHLWEGQSLWLIFAPMAAVVGGGFAWTGWKYNSHGKKPDNVKEWGLLTSSFLYIGSGAMMVLQMIVASSKAIPGPGVLVTIIFALLPLVLGYKLWEESSDYKDPDRSRRIKVIVYGILGLFVWAGIIIGPVIAMISAILPSKESN